MLGHFLKCQVGILGWRHCTWKQWFCVNNTFFTHTASITSNVLHTHGFLHELDTVWSIQDKARSCKNGVPWQTFIKWTVRYVKRSLSWFLVLTDHWRIPSLSSTKQEELVDKTFLLQRCVNPELGIKKLKSVIYIYIDIKIDDHTKTKKVKEISMSILYIYIFLSWLFFVVSYFVRECPCDAETNWHKAKWLKMKTHWWV